MFTPAFSSDAMLGRKSLMPTVNPDKAGNPIKHPAAKAPRIFADSATRADIEPLFRAGIINGITTNPSLLKKAGARSWDQAKTIMRDLCALLKPHPVSLELTELVEEAMVRQASELAELGDNAVIKVPIGGDPGVEPSAGPPSRLQGVLPPWGGGGQGKNTPLFHTTPTPRAGHTRPT